MNTDESKAIGKLIGDPFPFETPRFPDTVANLRRKANEYPEGSPVRVGLLERAEEKASVKISGEIWPLTYREALRVRVLLMEGREEASDASPKVRQEFVETLSQQLSAQACLRVPGTQGKLRVLTHDQAAQLDPTAATEICMAYNQAFVLEESERPKAETPQPTGV